MRSIDTIMKKTSPKWWYGYKIRKIAKLAEKELKKNSN
jgi:hypothetical protein